MQTGCQQTDNAPYDFALETAMTQIAARGYYLFTGSTRLLEARTVARPAIPKLSSISDVPFGIRLYCDAAVATTYPPYNIERVTENE